jgi:hypothetical protein
VVDGVEVVDLLQQKLFHILQRYVVNGGGNLFDKCIENPLCAKIADLLIKIVEIEFGNGSAKLPLLLICEFDFHGTILFKDEAVIEAEFVAHGDHIMLECFVYRNAGVGAFNTRKIFLFAAGVDALRTGRFG